MKKIIILLAIFICSCQKEPVIIEETPPATLELRSNDGDTFYFYLICNECKLEMIDEEFSWVLMQSQDTVAAFIHETDWFCQNICESPLVLYISDNLFEQGQRYTLKSSITISRNTCTEETLLHNTYNFTYNE